jgi:hypothetical protein
MEVHNRGLGTHLVTFEVAIRMHVLHSGKWMEVHNRVLGTHLVSFEVAIRMHVLHCNGKLPFLEHAASHYYSFAA